MTVNDGVRRRARPLLGTRVEIRVEGDAGRDAAIDAAFEQIAEVHRRMSAHQADSDLARVHAAAVGTVVAVSPHTARVVRAALAWAARSEGAFDPCLGAAMAALGYLPRSDRLGQGDYRALEVVDDRHLRCHQPLRLDLGGIAKGYAVDLAIETLQAAGIVQAVVNAGGDLRCCGPRPEPAAVRDPADPTRVAAVVQLRNAAMATSAAYFSERLDDGQPVSALYNPRTQSSHTGPFSISIVAATAMAADALTKVALNAPPELLQRLLDAEGASAHWLGQRP